MSIREEILRRVMYRPESMSVQQLQQSIRDGVVPGYIGIPVLQEKIKQQKAAMLAGQGQPQQPPAAPIADQVMQEASGIEALPGDVEAASMAGGGIVAFEEGGSTSPFGRWWDSISKPKSETDPEWGERQRLRSQIEAKYQPLANIGGFFRSQTPEQRAQAQAVMSGIDTLTPDQMRVLLGQAPTGPIPAMPTAPAAGASATPTAPAPAPAPAPTAAPAPSAPSAPIAPTAVARPSSGVASLLDADKLFESASKGMPAVPAPDYSKSEANVAEMKKTYESGKDRAFDEALVQAGLAMMAGTSPYALTNIGAGGIAGMKAYATGQKDLRDLHKDILNAEAKMEQAKNEGNEKAYARAANERDARIGLIKTAEEIKGRERVAEIYGNKQITAQDRAMLNADITMLKQQIALKEKEKSSLTLSPAERKQVEAELALAYANLKELTGMSLGPQQFKMGSDGVLRVNRP